MGFGIKRRSRELASRAFNVIVIPEVERYHWPEKSYLQRFLRILDIDCVFDVGANRGQYGKLLRSLGFTGLIVSFEPNPVPYAELLKQRDDKWICFPYGLGSEPGELPFNVMADDVFSSFLSPSGAEEYAAENSVVSTVTVPIKRLKDLLDEIGTSFSRPFLKLDTQGFDLEVIKGAGNTLSRFRGIVSEVAIKRLYARSPTFEESTETIARAGFQPAGMFSVNPYKTLSVIEMNAYFVRKDLVSLDPL
jgi:FkbM family methyltransferase